MSADVSITTRTPALAHHAVFVVTDNFFGTAHVERGETTEAIRYGKHFFDQIILAVLGPDVLKPLTERRFHRLSQRLAGLIR